LTAGAGVGVGTVVAASGFVSVANPAITGGEFFFGLGAALPLPEGTISPVAIEISGSSTSTIIGFSQQTGTVYLVP
jgi:hypothetical protein